MKRPSPHVVLLLLAVPVLLAGCGSGSTASGTPTAPAASSRTGPTTPVASATTGPSPGPATSAARDTQKPVAAESNPPGDIPDNLQFVPYASAAGKYRFTHPEGWLEKASGASVTFTDKLNGVQVAPGTATTVPTVATAKAQDVPALARSQAAFEARAVKAVTVPAGTGVRIVYRRNSAPDPVTGRQYRDEVERYELVAKGREVVIELYGPVGADNVDAYRTMVQSLRLS